MANEIYHRSNWGNAVNDIAWGDVYEKFDATNEMFIRSDYYENSNETDKLMADIYPNPSILLTPTAYDNGSLHSVKPVKTLGDELVTNGTFDTDSDWTKGTGWSISGGTANYNDSANASLYQNITLNANSYELKFSISNSSGSGARIWIGTSTGSVSYTDNTYQYYTNGDYTLTINVPSNQTTFAFWGNVGGSSFSIDSVSIKQVTEADFDFTRGSSATRVNEKGLIEDVQILSGELVTNGGFDTDSNWTKDSGWSIANGEAICNGVGINSLQQSGITTTGNSYKLTFDIISKSSDDFLIISTNFGDTYVNGSSTSIGTNTFYINPTSGTGIRFRVADGTTLTIDNVSVKEITDDTDLPRINYTNGEGSLLLEPQSTNLITNSEDFSGWSKDDITVESDSDTSPDGNNKATLLKGNTNSSRHHIRKTLSGTVDGSYSVFAKAKELRYLQIASINTTNQYVNFDLQDGLVGTVGSDFSNAKIEEIGSGWYRLSVTSDDRYNSFYISLVSGTNAVWLESWVMSNNTDGLYIWGAQLEQQSFSTSYIPTEGSTVTRLADVCNNAGSSDLINSTEGVLYAEISALANDGTNRALAISDGTTSNVVRFYYSVTDNRIVGNVKSGGTNVFSYNNVLTDATDFLKIAISYKANDFKMYVNGTEVSTDTSGSVPTSLTELAFDNGAGADDFYGNVKSVAVFQEALSDTELQNLTTI